MNLETTPKEVVRRLVDFLSGVTYAIDGNIKKVATGTYILTPPNVDIVGVSAGVGVSVSVVSEGGSFSFA